MLLINSFNILSTRSQFTCRFSKQMIRYLIQTSDLKIRYNFLNKNEENLMNYSDSAYNDNVIIRRLYLNYVFKLWNDLIFHSFKRQNIVVTFFIKIEYIVKCNATKFFFHRSNYDWVETQDWWFNWFMCW